MDTTPSSDLTQLLAELKLGRPLAPLTDQTYDGWLKAWWPVFAAKHDLPSDLSELDAPLSVDHLAMLIEAARSGELRRNTRAGARAEELDGQALAPGSVDGLMAAMRKAHEGTGLAWLGEDPDIRALRAAYRRGFDHQDTKARTITLDDLLAMFDDAPTCEAESADQLARVRAVASQLSLRIARAAAITPDEVTWDEDTVFVDVGRIRLQATCLGRQLQDVLVTATCAHCLLRAWVATSPPESRLLDRGQFVAARQSARRLRDTILDGRVRFTKDAFQLSDDPDNLWLLIAIAATPALAAWLRARAMTLPMLAVGMRCDDLDTAPRRLQRITAEKATLTVYPKGRGGEPRDIPLTATGGPLCPVGALRAYDNWVRVFLAERDSLFVPSRGQKTPRPVETESPPGSRATYQFYRTWLLEHGPKVAATGPRVRKTVTPHSAKRTFAQNAAAAGFDAAAIQKSMGHAKVSTTARYLEREVDPLAAPGCLTSRLAENRDAP